MDQAKYTKKFECQNAEEAKQMLKKYGVAVVKGVLDKETCKAHVDSAWEMLGYLTQKFEKPIKKGDKESYKTLYELYPGHSMLMQLWGTGHSQWVWDIRQDPRVVKVFQELWGVEKPEDMLVSFDGLSLTVPHEDTGRGYFRGNYWDHSDQSFKKKGVVTYQGIVNLRKVRKGDATLRVWPKSHLLHEEIGATVEKAPAADWYKYKDEQMEVLRQHDLKPYRVRADPGDLILFDSRTCHSGVEALKNREKKNTRAAVYTCYLPRTQATEKDLKRKRDAFEGGRMTSHNPVKFRLFGKKPQTYGKELGPITSITEKPQLTELGKKLAGY